MDFKEYVALNKKRVYDTICSYVPIKEPEEHYRIMRDYIDRQGNYRRPGLLLLTGQLYGAKIDDLVLPAAAQQLSEEWILMQDDIEDDSELRRGKPAAQKLYGWIHSLNATNSGHIAMWRIIKDYMLKAGPEKGNRLFEKFYDMLQYTVEGQFVENKFIHDTKDIESGSEDLYFRIVDSKTCYYTVYGPMQLGAIAAGQPDSVLAQLKEIGTAAGKAFQIVDDILDMTADESFGKQKYGDLYEGKLTLIILQTYKSADAREKAKIDAIYRKKRADKTKDEIDFLAEMVKKYGGIEYATKTANGYGDQAKALIKKYGAKMPDNEYRELLLNAVNELYNRNR